MRNLIYLFLLLLTVACAPAPATTDGGTATADDPYERFGADFPTGNAQPASATLTSYTEAALTDTVTTTLRGTVNEVCQTKGCWMTIDAGNGETMMVKFKDYGFFVPKDISGQEVIMNGIAYYQITPVDELRHYAEDAGKSEEEIMAIETPKKELRFLADGVAVVPRG